MNRNRLLLPMLIAVIIAAFAACLCGCQSTPPEPAPAAGEATAAADAADAPLPVVSQGIVQTGSIDQTLPLTGTLSVYRDQQAFLSAPVAGVLDFLPVRVGQAVSKGDIIAHVSEKTLQGQIKQAQAAVTQAALAIEQAQIAVLQQQAATRSGVLQAQSAVSVAQANRASAQAALVGNEAAVLAAQQSLERTQTLFAQGIVAQKDVEAARLALSGAQAQVAAQKGAIRAQDFTVKSQKQAEDAARTFRLQTSARQKDVVVARQQEKAARAALASVRAQTALYTLRAPLSGTITLVGAGTGETVDPANKIITIASAARLQLQIAVPTASAAQIQGGQSLSFTVDALPGQTFNSVVRRVGGQIDPASSTVLATAEVSNKEGSLKDGMTANVLLVVARHKNALLVPREAVLYAAEAGAAGAEAHVLTLDANGAVHQTSVTVGFTNDKFVEIISGLKAGASIVVGGGYGLEDGAKVQIGDAKNEEKP